MNDIIKYGIQGIILVSGWVAYCICVVKGLSFPGTLEGVLYTLTFGFFGLEGYGRIMKIRGMR